MGLRETVEFLRERDEVMVLATVTLVLTSRRFRSAGGIVVQWSVVSTAGIELPCLAAKL